MKHNKPMRTACSLAIAGMLMVAHISSGQNDFSSFVRAEHEDAAKLLEAYTAPAVRAVSFGMTNGWYNTAAPHSPLGFDISVSMSNVFTPSSDEYFTPANLGLKNTTLTGTTMPDNRAPAIFGPKATTTYTSTYTPPGGLPPQSVSFNGPLGLDLKHDLGFSAVPVPMVQVGVGIIKNTDIKIRFVPERGYGASRASMLGFGLMHDIKQHIPGIKSLPIDISILAAYNTVMGTTSLVNNNPSDTRPDSPDGKVTYRLHSWVAQALVSKKIAILTVYGGVGYGSVTTNVDVTGTYTIAANPAAFSIKDPASMHFSNTGVKLTAGMRIKLGPVFLNGDYTLQKYNALTVGVGLAVR
jgi:hypothetical protein